MAEKRQQRQIGAKKKEKSPHGGKRRGPQSSNLVDSPSASPSGVEDNESLQIKFERELLWCIEQLQLGISRQSFKRDSKQGQETFRILKVLENPKTPLIKKRQAMRQAFGDYRKKMEEEEKKFAANPKKMSLKVAGRDKLQSSTFYKRAGVLQSHPTSLTPDVSTSDHKSTVEMDPKFRFTPSKEAFKFNFNATNEKKENSVNGNSSLTVLTSRPGTETDCGLPELAKMDLNKEPSPQNNDLDPALNYYRMETTSQEFRFNFPPADGT